jgi:hypothetical protein
MSYYSMAEEIMPGRADYLVEQRGFEPLTSAVQAPARFTASSLPVLQSGRNGLRRDGFRRRFVSLRNAGPVLIADRNEPRYDVGPPHLHHAAVAQEPTRL